MKLFSIFLAIFFILLDIAPCGDKKDCDIYPGQETTLADSGNHSDNLILKKPAHPFALVHAAAFQ